MGDRGARRKKRPFPALDCGREDTVESRGNIQSDTDGNLYAPSKMPDGPLGLSIQLEWRNGMTDSKTLPACPVETALTLISDKWKVLILRDLMPGTKRFGALQKSIGGVSQKVLTAQLRQMEESGLLIRTVYPEVPPRVEYTLTDLGYSLAPVLEALRSWGEAYQVKRM